jgi:hypothetical protein
MLGKQTGQMGFGDLEAMKRLPEGHFLKKIDHQIIANAKINACRGAPAGAPGCGRTRRSAPRENCPLTAPGMRKTAGQA